MARSDVTSLRERVEHPAGENQLALFSQGDRLRKRYEQHRSEHPEFYAELLALAREAKARGWNRIGIAFLFERLRWQRGPAREKDDMGFAVNQDLRAYYARALVVEHPELEGLFELRALRSA